MQQERSRHQAVEQGAPRRPVDAQELFRGAREIEIAFRGDVYRLRITRNDKLILTK